MKDLSRQGIYRIAYDIIKADSLLSISEINILRRLCDDYGITQEVRESAMNMTLSEAVREVRTMPVRQMAKLVAELRELTLADGSCSREEALMLSLLTMCFDKSDMEMCDVVSVPWGEIMLDNNQVMYVENTYKADVNEYITEHYTHICNSFRIGGLDFVYIPKAMESLASTDNQLLNDIVYYLAPARTQEDAMLIAREIREMTTVKMYRELLLGKLRFPLDIIAPSLVIRIGYSLVNGSRMANYAVVRLAGNITAQVDTFIDGILSMQNSQTVVVSNIQQSSSSFVYAGCFRTLFDLVTYRRGVRHTIIIHPYSHGNVLSIQSENADGATERVLDLGPKESAFYVFLIRETQEHGGFNIASDTPESIRYLDEAQKRFEKTYFSLCNRDTAPDITNPDIRRPMLSKIRKAIDTCDILVQKMMFLPDTDRNKVVRVHVEHEQIMEM